MEFYAKIFYLRPKIGVSMTQYIHYTVFYTDDGMIFNSFFLRPAMIKVKPA
jgi:hypothetical protein